MERPTGAEDAEDGALGLVGRGLLGEGLVARRVEGLAERGDLLQAVAGERGLELLDGHGEAGGDRGAGLALGRGEAETEGVQGGQEILDHGSRGEAAEVGLVALVATGLVLLVGVGAQEGVPELGDLGLEGGEARVGRGLGSGRGIRHRVGHGKGGLMAYSLDGLMEERGKGEVSFAQDG